MQSDNFIYPNGLTKNQIISLIREVYHAGYDLNNPNFDIYDQLLACEAIAESEEEYSKKQNVNVNVSGNGNGSCKRKVNLELTESKIKVIKDLKACNHRTPIYEIATLLEKLFFESKSQSGHWAYISERWPPKAINCILNSMTKQHGADWKTLRNPAAYFTHLIKYRKKRKTYRKNEEVGLSLRC